jgi:MFS family permease
MLAFATAVVVTTEFIVVGLLPEMARDLGVTVAAAGWFVTWFALASALFGPPLTVAASRLSPRVVLAATLLVFGVGNLVVTLAPDYAVIVVVRIAQGAMLPVLVSIGSASIARMAGPGREGKAVGLVYLGVATALVVAAPAGVALAEVSGWALSFGGKAIFFTVSRGPFRHRFDQLLADRALIARAAGSGVIGLVDCFGRIVGIGAGRRAGAAVEILWPGEVLADDPGADGLAVGRHDASSRLPGEQQSRDPSRRQRIGDPGDSHEEHGGNEDRAREAAQKRAGRRMRMGGLGYLAHGICP